jgi:hypothetical protein
LFSCQLFYKLLKSQAKRSAAIDRHHFAIDKGGGVGDQKCSNLGNLAGLTDLAGEGPLADES